MGNPPQAAPAPTRESFRIPGARIRITCEEPSVWRADFFPSRARRPAASTSFLLDAEHVVIGRVEARIKRRHYATRLLRALSEHYHRPVIPYLVDSSGDAALPFWQHLRETASFVDTRTPWPTTDGTGAG